jgi:multiple sugar transport system ATP-binding protein
MVHAELRELRKEYDDVVAVDDVSFTLKDGEFLVLLGPSGCGKSTTLRTIAGLEDVNAGEIVVDGEVVNDQSPAERDFALVFQEVALYPHMSVFDNISSPLRAAGVDRAEREERVKGTAGLLDIEELLDRNPSELSGGQQQRVAIGRALVREPRAFLLDEPLSKLDQKLRIQLQKELKQLQAEMNITTVFVTHDQEEAMVLADRIAVMDDGELQQIDTPENIYQKPTNRFVAEFIGNPTMNFFDAEVRNDILCIDDITYEDWEGPGDASAIRSMAARPEDIRVSPANADDDRLVAEVSLVEMRGSTAYFICELDEREVTILKKDDEAVTEGDRLALNFAFENVNFFDERGELVRLTQQASALR